MNAARAMLYARTLRHLRPVQVYGRAWRALWTRDADLSPAPPRRVGVSPLTAPADRPPVLVGPTRLDLLGEESELASAADWNDPAITALRRYHLHYFDDLRSRGAEGRERWNGALIERWIRENPAGVGVGWDPYPTSLRIVNWVRRAMSVDIGGVALHSLAVQARHLRANLERHLLGNHLLANAKALVFTGTFFDGREAREWRDTGLALLRRELREQVLSDGGHFERSPMYHALVLEDVLDLVALATAAPGGLGEERRRWIQVASAMRTWLAAMTHPDGEIALFNDAAIGQAPSPAALDDYARRLGLGDVAPAREGVTWLEPSGYVRVATGDLVALLDVGEIGPSYLPGHAHADTLSFEASLGGHRWLVDSGTSLYEPGSERLHQRSTAAHNTVEVDGESSSEVWSSFRVARRAHVRDVTVEESGNGVHVRASHNGYRRLAGRPVHERRWQLAPGLLRIDDRLRGEFESAVARVHLHPDLRVELGGAPRIEHPRGGAAALASEGGALSVRPGTWHPRFGAALPSSHIRLDLDRRCPLTRAQLTLSW